jgi:hypothetical protein
VKQSQDICEKLHAALQQEIMAEMGRLEGDIRRFEDTTKRLDTLLFKGGNGNGISLVEQVHLNTAFRVDVQAMFRKINYKIWGIAFGILVVIFRNVIVDILK